jgi:outer membrane protein assembly factor BamB
MQNTPSLLSLWLFGVGAATAPFASAQDWPHQRGPEQNGSVPADVAVPNTLPDEPRVVWKRPVTDGFAAPIITGGKVIYGDFQKRKEIFHALKLSDAEALWHEDLGAPHKDGFGTGPRCAPVSDGEIVLLQSCLGDLHCVDLASGDLLWKKSYQSDFGAPYTGEKGKTEGAARHGYAASACIDGDHVITLVGAPGAGVVCFEKTSGEVVWQSQDDQAAYSPPLVATLAGVEQVICFTVSGVLGLDRDDGKLLWRVPLSTNYGRHITAPTVHGDMVIVGSHEVGLIAIRVTNKGGTISAEEAWKLAKEMGPNFASPICIGDHLYLLAGKQIVCLDVRSGEHAWAQNGLIQTAANRAFAAFIGMGDRIMMLNDSGELILFKADPKAYGEISRVQVCGKNWCHPAYAAGKLVVRDAKNLICIDLMSGE